MGLNNMLYDRKAQSRSPRCGSGFTRELSCPIRPPKTLENTWEIFFENPNTGVGDSDR